MNRSHLLHFESTHDLHFCARSMRTSCLVQIYTRKHGLQLFIQRKLRRKRGPHNHICWNCGFDLYPGEKAWSEISGNAMNRSARICCNCMSRSLKATKEAILELNRRAHAKGGEACSSEH